MNNISKIQKAIKFAVKTHEIYQKQTRKGKDVSYIIHPLTVGLILSQVGADNDVVCAGILHDTVEDSIPEKKVTYEMLEDRFGKRVAEMVLDVSEKNKQLPWKERKKDALLHIKNFSSETLLLKSADIISNVSEIIDDYYKDGDLIFTRFKAPEPKKENIIDNYMTAMKTILSHWDSNPLENKLNFLVGELKKIKEIQ